MIHITFTNGSNPYLTNAENFYKWFYNYDIKTDEGAILFVTATEIAIKKTYQQAKEAARAFAIETQRVLHEDAPSYYELADVQNVLHAIGKRFGLLREFRENCIC